MELTICNLIIGAGASGLLHNNTLPRGETIIIERGYQHGKTSDYVVFLKDKNKFTNGEIDVLTENHASGCRPYELEYSEKVYNKEMEIDQFSGGEYGVYSKGYPLDLAKLVASANIYGNIEATKIDLKNKVLYGRILHLGKAVKITYQNLISTIPIFEFTKLAGINLLKDFGIFISYYPIGIKRVKLECDQPNMVINYYSDPNIPYYRTQEYGQTKYYEYCINKKFDMRFDSVILPGKFTSQPVGAFHNYMKLFNVTMVGRFARWDPSFLLDDILEGK